MRSVNRKGAERVEQGPSWALYSVFLARNPPGMPGVLSWTSSPEALKGAGCGAVVFGDYDLHVAVPVHHRLPTIPGPLRELLVDHHEMLLADLSSSPDDFPTRWRSHAETFPTVTMIELGVQQRLLGRSRLHCLVAIARLLRRLIQEKATRWHCTMVLEVLINLGSSDLVCYIFGDDLERADDFATFVRGLTRADLDAALREEAHEELGRALDLCDLSQGQHVFQSSYTIHGVVTPSDGTFVLDPRAVARRITDRASSLRPILLIGTFPGHEGDGALRSLLRPHGQPALASGVFDLVVSPLKVAGLPGRRPTQRQVIRAMLSTLQRMWRRLGPRSERPTIVRTNTLLTRVGRSLRPRGLPHHVYADGAMARVAIDRTTQSLEAGWGTLDRLASAVNAALANHQSAHVVVDVREAVVRLAQAFGDEAGRLWPRRKPADVRREREMNELLRATQDAAERLEGILASRVAGTNHTIREEVASRQGGALHKLITFYRDLCWAFLNEHRAALCLEEPPAIVIDVEDLHDARAQLYLPNRLGHARLVIAQVLDSNLLHPARAFFPLAHELMHAFMPPTVKERLADAVVPEVCDALVRAAREEGAAAFPAVNDPTFPARVLATLRDDLAAAHMENDRAPEGRRRGPMAVAWFVVRCLLTDAAVLLATLLPTDDLDALPRLDAAQVDALGRLQGALIRRVLALQTLMEEATADALAAFLTSPESYLRVLRESRAEESDRHDVLDALLRSRRGEAFDVPPRPLVATLRAILDALPLTHDRARYVALEAPARAGASHLTLHPSFLGSSPR